VSLLDYNFKTAIKGGFFFNIVHDLKHLNDVVLVQRSTEVFQNGSCFSRASLSMCNAMSFPPQFCQLSLAFVSGQSWLVSSTLNT